MAICKNGIYNKSTVQLINGSWKYLKIFQSNHDFLCVICGSRKVTRSQGSVKIWNNWKCAMYTPYGIFNVDVVYPCDFLHT